MTDIAHVGHGHPIANWAKTVSRVMRERRRRKGFKRLLDLDDALLKDIGVMRSEVLHCAHLPLSSDAATELRRISLSRRLRMM